jgi:hypothetical protein
MVRRVCGTTGKACYGGRNDARKAHRQAGYRLRIYECPDCGAWHATNADVWRRNHGDTFKRRRAWQR